jgi:2-hydroxychromene-2-carboxylate isomerase
VGKGADFLFDVMSPFSYLASTQLDAVAKRTGATFRWVPVHLPGVIRDSGNKAPLEIPAKALYFFKDCNDWAGHYGLPPIVMPDDFPSSGAAAGRAMLAADELGRGSAFGAAMFKAVWVDHRSTKDEAVIAAALTAVGLDAAKCLERSKSDELREKLKANTKDAVDRGAFGVPTFFVGGEMFVGNDRLTFVEKALCR